MSISIVYAFDIKNDYIVRVAISGVAIMCGLLTWVTNVINYDIQSLDTCNVNLNIPLYRIDLANTYNFSDNSMNQSMVDGYSTTTEYFSIDNPGYINGRYKLGLGDSYLITGFDNRSILQTLASVKYIFSDNNSEYKPPYGFYKSKSLSNKDIIVYNNEYALPMAYLYTKKISMEEFDSLDSIEKQVAMTEFMAYGDAFPQKQYIDENVVESSNIAGIMTNISESGITYKLTCLCKKNKETYLLVDNYFFSGSVSIDGYMKRIWGEGINSINLGFYNEDTMISVEFSCEEELDPNQFHIKEIDIIPIFQKNVEKLKEKSVNDVRISNNAVWCNLDTADDTYLCVSIPYTKGWKGYLDGNKTDIFAANDIFIGMVIPTGKHEIELRYETPGLRIGLIISLSTILCLILFCVIERKKNDQNDTAVI